MALMYLRFVKTNHHHLPLRRRRRGKKPLPFTSGRFKGKRPRASPRLSERGPRDDRCGRTKRRKRKRATREISDCSAFRDISHKGKKKLKLAPRINRDETRRTCSRESSLCNFWAQKPLKQIARVRKTFRVYCCDVRVVFILSYDWKQFYAFERMIFRRQRGAFSDEIL